jgi:hypothetical protein
MGARGDRSSPVAVTRGGVELLRKVVALPHLDRVTIGIVEAKDPLPPSLLYDRVDEVDVIIDAREARVNVVVFEVVEDIAPSVGGPVCPRIAPYGRCKLRPIMV